MKVKNYIYLILLGLAIVTLSGCAVISKSQKPIVYPENLPPLGYKFNYSPLKEENPGKGTIALVKTNYGIMNSPDIQFTINDNSVKLASMNNEDMKQVCNSYLDSINSDFNETLIAKGYTLLGPFQSMEEMTYGEKEKSNLALIASLNLKLRFEDTTTRNNAKNFSQRSSMEMIEVGGKLKSAKIIQVIGIYSGNLIVEGFIELIMMEPLTGEKMWIKQIKVPFEIEPYDYYVFQEGYQYVDIIGQPVSDLMLNQTKLIKESDFRPRALAKTLEKVYVSQLDFFSKYFDPKEISFVLKDAEKVRKLKRY